MHGLADRSLQRRYLGSGQRQPCFGLDQVEFTQAVADNDPPTLPAANIVDNKGGASVDLNTKVTYTLTFSEDINAATVNSIDFSNAGTSAITIGAITETSPGVLSVEVTPTTIGNSDCSTRSPSTLRA